ncbi:MAG: O-antigen ligase family protein [bacterium]
MGKRSKEKKLRRDGLIPNYKQEREEKSTLEKICLFIIKWGVCLALFTPLIISGKFFFPYVGPKSLYFMAWAQIIFFAYLLLAVTYPKYRPKFNIVSATLLLFTIILILSSIFGADPSYSFWSKYERVTGLLMWFHLMGFFIATSAVFKKEDWFKVFAVSVFSGVLASLMSLAPKIGIDISGASAKGGATLGNTSFLATYLLFNIFFALYLFFKTNHYFKAYAAVSFVLISVALMLSTGRAAIASFVGGMILLFILWLIFCRKGKWKFTGISLLIVSVLGVIGTVYVFLQPGSFLYQKMTARYVVWAVGWQGFLEKPLLGWGPENFDLVFTKYFNSCMFLQECGTEIWFDRTHNVVFDTLVTTGIIGLLSYLAIFLAVFYALWKNYLKKKIDFWSAGIFAVLLIAYFVQNLTVFDMVSSYMLWFLVLGFIAFLAEPSFRQRPDFYSEEESGRQKEILAKSRRRTLNPWLGMAVLLMFLFSFNKFVIKTTQTDAYVIEALRSPIVDQRIDFYEKTLNASPLGKYQIREMFGNNALSLLQNKEKAGISEEDLAREIAYITKEMEKSVQESPLNYRNYLKLGEMYAVQSDRIADAEETFRKAIALSPSNQQGYWSLARIKASQGNKEEAVALVEKAIDLNERVVESHSRMIQIAFMLNDFELAQEKSKQALPFALAAVETNRDFQPYWNLVQIAQIAGEFELAQQKAAEAISLNPDWAEKFEPYLAK